MLVRERGVEVELMVRAAGESVAQSGGRGGRVEIAIVEVIGLCLVGGTVIHVGERLAVPAGRVGGAAGRGGRQRPLGAQPRLFQVGQRSLVVILAKDRVT